ncbi:MAG TPA: rhodanese-related sulfurtransferase [Panacibacter sp.]|nr:rhodanese-related sulfurtransferase [Panacibacter sp.]HNP43523.1 rhodanese-related sulfurtransferase [Panacibacter sp.]
MAVLHNRISNAELKQQMRAETEKRITVSFYEYFYLSDPKAFRDELYKHLYQLKVFGRIYVASEGINAQVSVPASNFDAFKGYLYSIKPLDGLRLNIAVDDDGKSFWVLKIKVREKIVADGISDASFDMRNKGSYVNAKQMNELMNNPSTILVDMRNHYEYEVGHFAKAIEVPSDTFRDQLPMAVDMLKGQEDKNIVMYCTGGIRCEKASAFLKHKGFKSVFHLEGGIINYAKQIRQEGLESRFIGKNFVFDDRLGERITEDVIAHCHQCGKPCDTHTNCKNDGCHLLFIQCEACAEKYAGCCSEECRDTLDMPLERRREIRKGVNKGQNIFNKSRLRLRPRLTDLIKEKSGNAAIS